MNEFLNLQSRAVQIESYKDCLFIMGLLTYSLTSERL